MENFFLLEVTVVGVLSFHIRNWNWVFWCLALWANKQKAFVIWIPASVLLNRMTEENNIWSIEVCIVRSYKDLKCTVKLCFIASLIVSEHSAKIKKVMISSTVWLVFMILWWRIFFFYFMNLWWTSKIHLIQQLCVLQTNGGNTLSLIIICSFSCC